MSLPGTPVICRTKKSHDAFATGGHSSRDIHQPRLVARSFFVGPGGDVVRGILRPITMQAMVDQFGVSKEDAFKVYCDWVDPLSERYPVAVGEWLCLPNGEEHEIHGVSLQRAVAITLLVSVPQPEG